MPQPVLKWYDSAGTTLSPTLSFTGLVPGGSLSAPQTLRFYNDHSGTTGSDPALGVKIFALSRNTPADPYVTYGHPIVDSRRVFMRITGGTAVGAWDIGVRALGAGSMITFPTIASGEYVEVSVEVGIPAGYEIVDAQVTFGHETLPTLGMGEVATLATRGVDWGIGRRSFSEILDGFTIAPTGTPDAFVTFGDLLATVQGRPVVDLGGTFEFTNLDSAAAALAAGQAYFGLVSAGPAGVTVTKGVKAVTPLTVANEPALPAGHKRLGRVLRAFDGLIDSVDIQVSASPVGFDHLGSTGRVVSISGGRAAVGTQLAVPAGSNLITITASTTETVYVLGDGSLTTAPGGSVDALPLWEFTADGSSILSSRDRRSWAQAGGDRDLSLLIASGADEAASYAVLPSGPSLGINPVAGITASLLDSDPSALGATSGSWRLEIEYRAIGAASFTTLFTSSGTSDRRPVLAEASTDPEFSRGLPEVVVIPGGATIRARIESIPTGGTPAAGVVVRIPLCEVS